MVYPPPKETSSTKNDFENDTTYSSLGTPASQKSTTSTENEPPKPSELEDGIRKNKAEDSLQERTTAERVSKEIANSSTVPEVEILKELSPTRRTQSYEESDLEVSPPKRRQILGEFNIIKSPEDHQAESTWCKPASTNVTFQSRQRMVDEEELGIRERDENGDIIVEEDDMPGKDSISLRCALVILVGPNGEKVKVNALLDDGSNRTLIDKKLARKLSLETKEETELVLKGVKGKTTREVSELVEFTLESVYQKKTYRVMASTATNPVGGLYPVHWDRVSFYWSHLRGLEIAPMEYAPCQLLIGSDYPHLMKSLGEIYHKDETKAAPIARVTPLGITVTGPLLPAKEHRDERAARKEKERREKEGKAFFTAHKLLVTDRSREARVMMVVTERPSTKDLEKLILRSMEMERLPGDEEVAQTRSQEDLDAERILSESRTHDGTRYSVSVLWKPGEPNLPNNRRVAEKRMVSLEKSFRYADERLRAQYIKEIEGWEEKGYFVRVPKEEEDREDCFYIPHFMVVREDKTTTKVRPVLDGAAKFQGKCLNDAVYIGPKNICEVFDVLLRLRKHPVAFMGDVEGMFLQIENKPNDRRYQRILFRKNPGDPLYVLEPTRHIFGNAGSPCIAIHVIKQHAKENMDKYPRAAEAVIHSSIVDDVLDSVETPEEAIKVISDLITMLNDAGMKIRKFMSNSKEVLKHLGPEMTAKNVDIEMEGLSTASQAAPVVKSLGIVWIVEEDAFTFVKPDDVKLKPDHWNKRRCLSVSHQIYDPLGWIAPVQLMAKVFIHLVWMVGLDWDEPLSEELTLEWLKWIEGLPDLSKVRVPRCLLPINVNPTLHTFADASGYAFGAVCYLVSGPLDSRVVRLVSAITRVVGKEGISIPRLELCAAKLAVLQALKIKKALGEFPSFFWSDSTNVLCWLKHKGRQRKMFVANRIRDVMTHSKAEDWFWVPTEDNPADLASRGAMPSTLLESDLWFQGPEWLLSEEWPETPEVLELSEEAKKEDRPDEPVKLKFKTNPKDKKSEKVVESFLTFDETDEDIAMDKYADELIEGKHEEICHALIARAFSLNEMRKSGVPVKPFRRPEITISKEVLLYWKKDNQFHRVKIEQSQTPYELDIEYHSNLGTLVVYNSMPVYWLSRFYQQIPRNEPRDLFTLYSQTLLFIVRRHQQRYFEAEILALQQKKQVAGTSPLQVLCPVFEKDSKVLRVSSRAQHKSNPRHPDSLKPLIVAGKSHLAKLIVRHTHEKELSHEGGVNHLATQVQRTFWIPGLRVLAKQVLKACVICRRHAARRTKQQMAPLPEFRIPNDIVTYPFSTTALDCAGPFVLKKGNKVWIVVFSCAEYRAIHVEMLEHMSTDSFLLAFRRFVSTRGVPMRIVSDNGTNFVGASNAFLEMQKKVECRKVRASFPQIQWLFTTPYCPHAGGVFERMVKAVKITMGKMIGFHIMPSEEVFRTILAEVSALLNSRPLTCMTDSVTDLAPITPNHFLGVGPRHNVDLDTQIPFQERYNRLQNIVKDFKTQFVRELVPMLHTYPKGWIKKQEDIQVGEIVTLIEATHTGSWPLAQVIEVYRGQDGHVRSVDLLVALPKNLPKNAKVLDSKDESKVRWSTVKCGKACQFVKKIYNRDIRRLVRLGVNAPLYADTPQVHDITLDKAFLCAHKKESEVYSMNVVDVNEANFKVRRKIRKNCKETNTATFILVQTAKPTGLVLQK